MKNLFKIENRLIDTDSRHSDMVVSIAYMIASQYAKLHEDYVLLHISKKPWYIPEFVFKWVLKKVLVINRFKKL